LRIRILIWWNWGYWYDSTDNAYLIEIKIEDSNLMVSRMLIYWSGGFWFNGTEDAELLE